MLTFDYKHFHSQFVIYVYQTFKERINNEKSNRQSGKPWTCSI